MARLWVHAVVECLRRSPGLVAEPRGDGDLLAQFLATGDRTAFEVLVWRHGAMVYDVCRRALGDAHEAEDAFQATFLVFVKKAGSIGRRGSVGSWLFKVAHRIAGRLRAQAARRPAGA